MTDEFIITDGTRFIRQDVHGRYKPVANITMADTYSSRCAALNVLNNSIPKAWKQTYYVAQVKNGEIIQRSAPQPVAQKRHSGIKYCPDADPILLEWYNKIEALNNLFSYFTRRDHEISQEMSDIDQAIADISHFIEFNKLGAGDGYKIYAKQHELLCRRRCLKNELELIKVINKNHVAKDAVSNIFVAIKDLKKRKYEPRILGELFTDGVKALR